MNEHTPESIQKEIQDKMRLITDHMERLDKDLAEFLNLNFSTDARFIVHVYYLIHYTTCVLLGFYKANETHLTKISVLSNYLRSMESFYWSEIDEGK